MLSSLRALQKTKLGTAIVASSFILILIGFASTGVRDFGTGSFGFGSSSTTLATVGGEQVNLRAPAGFEPPVGQRCGVRPDPGRVHLFNPDTEAAITTAAGNVPAVVDPNPEGGTG